MGISHAMGWLRDWPDYRDYTVEHEEVKPLLQRSSKLAAGLSKAAPERRVDLREWCSPVEDQESLGSCTANAGIGLLEYYQNRALGEYLDGSRLFLYKVTRSLLHLVGDTGAYLRTTAKAMTLFGVPPAEYWPYDMSRFDEEPPAFLYAYAQNYKSIKFYRHDSWGANPDTVLRSVKWFLDAGFPAMFGFTVYSSIWAADGDGEIPYPAAGDRVEGGHAVVAVGYDDEIQIRRGGSGTGDSTEGAFLIRNSWGTDWGNAGYGYLPYEYLLRGLAVDWWSLIKNEWMEEGAFD